MPNTENSGDTGDNNNKRQASSPAMGSEDEIKRRNVLHKLDIDNIEVPGLPSATRTTELQKSLNDEVSKSIPEGKSADGRAEPTLAEKVDLLTCKMDKVLEYLVTQKDSSDIREQINCSKFKLLEKSHNNVIDKLAYIDLDLGENKTKIEQNAINIESNEDSLNVVQTQLRLLKAADSEKTLLIKDMQNKMKSYDKLLRETQSNVLDLGQEVRDRNLVIAGVREQQDEDILGVAIDELNKILKQAISSFKVDPKNALRRPKFRNITINDIDNAYRIGRIQKGKRRPRNISVTFSVGHIKHMVISAKAFMKNPPKGFFIGEDLRPEARAHRSNLKLIAAGAKSLGLETKISGNKLTIDSEVYTPEELPAVDEDIISASKHQKTVKDGIAFKGDRSVFSNFFPAPFIIEEYEYANVEQYFQFVKATECGYDRLARKVLLKDNPWYCKATGGRATPNEQWKSIRLRTLYKGIFAKFDQNGPLKQVLLDTDGLNLYEATTDLYWGCGIDIDSDLWEKGEWNGENVCGKILVKVREEFLRESNLGRSTEDTLMDIEMNSSTDLLSTSDCIASSSPQSGAPVEYEEDWPSVGDISQRQKSYNEVVKSTTDTEEKTRSSATSFVSSTPKLTRGNPQVTPNRGRGRGNRNPRANITSSRSKPHMNFEKLSNDDKEFLAGGGRKPPTEKKHNVQRFDNGQPKIPSSTGPALSNNKTRKSPKSNHRNKKTDFHAPGTLSPKQRQAISQIGLEPNSNFVQSIASSKANNGVK